MSPYSICHQGYTCVRVVQDAKRIDLHDIVASRLRTRVVVPVASENFDKFEKPSLMEARESFINLIVKAYKVGPWHDPRKAFEEHSAF
jgi:hypothetical protein